MSTEFLDRFNLASVRLGAVAVGTSDDFFAEKENLLRAAEPVFKEHEYTDRGKWMDGWESRRKRSKTSPTGVSGGDDFDWAIVRLGLPGRIRGVDVDTRFFRGNYPEECSIQACALPIDAHLDDLMSDKTSWVEILERTPLKGDSHNPFPIECPHAFTHVRLNIFPDGGVARLRVHGDVMPDWKRNGHARGEIDLAGVQNGGDVLTASDMFFGERRNLIMPDRAPNMSDGWETRRRRGPGNDWAIVRLGAPGSVTRLEIDTSHFRGNFPDTCIVEGCYAPGATTADLATGQGIEWEELLPRTRMQEHTRHFYETQLRPIGPITHVRLHAVPCGGVSRLRVYGTIDEAVRSRLGVLRFDALPPAEARAELLACSSSTRWVDEMLAARPLGTVEEALQASAHAWAKTADADWREAMTGHPRIGEKKAAASDTNRPGQGWSAQEQAGMSQTTDATREAIAAANVAYENKFGFTYIVCATGKTAEEMLALVTERLKNDPDTELKIAAAELAKINDLRLYKLIDP